VKHLGPGFLTAKNLIAAASSTLIFIVEINYILITTFTGLKGNIAFYIPNKLSTMASVYILRWLSTASLSYLYF
jgi:hypothetical protein